MKYSGVGIQLVAIMMIAWWIGLKIEKNTSMVEPWGQIFGLFFGIFSGIYNLLKSVKN
tara:strand:- start:171 stop:344 length:174 start_codon:yes stop_codon:yes gene_type:complete